MTMQMITVILNKKQQSTIPIFYQHGSVVFLIEGISSLADEAQLLKKVCCEIINNNQIEGTSSTGYKWKVVATKVKDEEFPYIAVHYAANKYASSPILRFQYISSGNKSEIAKKVIQIYKEELLPLHASFRLEIDGSDFIIQGSGEVDKYIFANLHNLLKVVNGDINIKQFINERQEYKDFKEQLTLVKLKNEALSNCLNKLRLMSEEKTYGYLTNKELYTQLLDLLLKIDNQYGDDALLSVALDNCIAVFDEILEILPKISEHDLEGMNLFNPYNKLNIQVSKRYLVPLQQLVTSLSDYIENRNDLKKYNAALLAANKATEIPWANRLVPIVFSTLATLLFSAAIAPFIAPLVCFPTMSIAFSLLVLFDFGIPALACTAESFFCTRKIQIESNNLEKLRQPAMRFFDHARTEILVTDEKQMSDESYYSRGY